MFKIHLHRTHKNISLKFVISMFLFNKYKFLTILITNNRTFLICTVKWFDLQTLRNGKI